MENQLQPLGTQSCIFKGMSCEFVQNRSNLDFVFVPVPLDICSRKFLFALVGYFFSPT